MVSPFAGLVDSLGTSFSGDGEPRLSGGRKLHSASPSLLGYLQCLELGRIAQRSSNSSTMAQPINGRWMLEKSDGLIDFLRACGADPEIFDMAKNLEITGDAGGKEEFQHNGSNLTRRIITPTGQVHQEITMEFNKEKEGEALDGRKIKATLKQDSPNKYSREEIGEGYTANWLRTIEGDKMTLVMKVGNVTCTRVYKRA